MPFFVLSASPWTHNKKTDKIPLHFVCFSDDLFHKPFSLLSFVIILVIPVSYTHLDVYKRQILPSSAYDKLMEKIADGKKVKLETESWSYEDICKQDFYLLPACLLYTSRCV